MESYVVALFAGCTAEGVLHGEEQEFDGDDDEMAYYWLSESSPGGCRFFWTDSFKRWERIRFAGRSSSSRITLRRSARSPNYCSNARPCIRTRSSRRWGWKPIVDLVSILTPPGRPVGRFIRHVIPSAFIAAVIGSAKKIGSTRSITSPETSRKLPLFSRGINARHHRCPFRPGAAGTGTSPAWCPWMLMVRVLFVFYDVANFSRNGLGFAEGGDDQVIPRPGCRHEEQGSLSLLMFSPGGGIAFHGRHPYGHDAFVARPEASRGTPAP